MIPDSLPQVSLTISKSFENYCWSKTLAASMVHIELESACMITNTSLIHGGH